MNFVLVTCLFSFFFKSFVWQPYTSQFFIYYFYQNLLWTHVNAIQTFAWYHVVRLSFLRLRLHTKSRTISAEINHLDMLCTLLCQIFHEPLVSRDDRCSILCKINLKFRQHSERFSFCFSQLHSIHHYKRPIF